MSAWRLAHAGHSVTVYDQWNSPNDRGASVGESRIFRTHYKEGPEYVPLIQKSRELWNDLQEADGTSFLKMCGGLTIGATEHPDIRAVIDCAEAADLDYSVLPPDEMIDKYPQFHLDEDEVGVYDPAAGIFRPEMAVLAARKASQALGATYRPYTKVLNVRPTSGSVLVDTADNATPFDKVVLATGPWGRAMSGLSPELITPKRLVGGWFPARDVALHQPRNMPISVRRHAEGGFSCFPVLDGAGVKILPHHVPWKALESPEDLPRLVEPDLVRAMERAVAALLPHLEPTAVRVATWTDGFTPDGAPVVSLSPHDERIVLAMGMSGQGFKFSPMVGSIINDLVTTGASEDLISVMSIDRFQTAQ